MVRTLSCHCRAHGFNPWSGNQDPASHPMWPKKKKKRRVYMLLFRVIFLKINKFFQVFYCMCLALNS